MCRVRIRLKLVKKDFGKWDKEELSLIVKGYTARQIADHILDNQKRCDMLQTSYDESERCLIERGVIIEKLNEEITYLQELNNGLNYSYDEIVSRLKKEIKKLPKCFSKECMGCEVDMQRHILNKILGDKK